MLTSLGAVQGRSSTKRYSKVPPLARGQTRWKASAGRDDRHPAGEVVVIVAAVVVVATPAETAGENEHEQSTYTGKAEKLLQHGADARARGKPGDRTGLRVNGSLSIGRIGLRITTSVDAPG